MKRDWAKLVENQKKIIESGFSSGNALICGGNDGIFFENYEGFMQGIDAVTDCSGSGKAGNTAGNSTDPLPVTRDTIFHLYSMTKVFTVTAALMLAEQGLIDIDAPVSRYIKEYDDVKVRKNGRAEPAVEILTVRSLFTMTSGLSYFLDDPGGARKFAERWRKDVAAGNSWDTVRFARELASVPLEFEPGERYRYGLSHDVLGAIIELVSGKTLDAFFTDSIFRPLGMDNTFFRQDLPSYLEPKLAGNTAFINGRYQNIPLPPKPIPVPLFEGIDSSAVFSGGSGLVGTARDYGIFLSEFLRRDNRLLKPETVSFMTSPKLTASQRSFYNAPGSDNSISGPEHTFAFGVRVQDKEAASGSGSVGEWGWSGALGTWFFVSPADNVWFVYMHQHTPANHGAYIEELRNTFYKILKSGE